MPRTKEQYEAMREATHEKILSAAIKLFSKKGLLATGVQEIADEAGISVGLLYRHYKTKDDVFAALVMEALDGLEEVGKTFEITISPGETIRMVTEEIINDLNNEEFVQFMILILQPLITNQDFPWVNDIIKRHIYLREQLAKLIIRGQKSGQFKEGNSEQMAQQYFSEIQGICMMKHFLKNDFISPTVEMITTFLFLEEHNDSR